MVRENYAFRSGSSTSCQAGIWREKDRKADSKKKLSSESWVEPDKKSHVNNSTFIPATTCAVRFEKKKEGDTNLGGG